MSDILYRVEVSFGMLVRDGRVADVATVAYWAKSKPIEEVLAWVAKQGGTWKIVSDGPELPRAEFVDAFTSCSPSTPPEKAEQIFDMLSEEKTEVRRHLSQAIKAVRLLYNDADKK